MSDTPEDLLREIITHGDFHITSIEQDHASAFDFAEWGDRVRAVLHMSTSHHPCMSLFFQHPYTDAVQQDEPPEPYEPPPYDEDRLPQEEHDLRTEGDEYICNKCHKRWGFDDTDIPECN